MQLLPHYLRRIRSPPYPNKYYICLLLACQHAPEEFKAAADDYVAYFGTYEVDDQKGTIVVHVEGALFPNWLGHEQMRFFDFSDDLLTLKTPSILSGGQEITGVLVWKRLL